ncbi:MAG: helix-turn-helix domain-containing protein [Sporolactobacillus sp.]
MTIGELLKQKRRELHLTQQQMCAGVLTVSFYSKVENNKHRISAEDLSEILYRQGLSETEFFDAYRASSDQGRRYRELSYRIGNAFYRGDRQELRTLMEELDHTALPTIEMRKIKLQMKFIAAALNEDYTIITDTDKRELKQSFFLQEDWSNGALALLANCMALYPLADIRPFIQSAFRLAGRHRSADRERDAIIMAIALNTCEMAIKEQSDADCAQALAVVAAYSSVPQSAFYKLMAAYYRALLDYRRSPGSETRQTIQSIIAALNAGGFTYFADNLSTFFDASKKK